MFCYERSTRFGKRELRWETRTGTRTGPWDPGLEKTWIRKFLGQDLGSGQITQIYSENTHSEGFPGVREMVDGRKSLMPAPNYDTHVEDLELV